ncbi:S-layer homology domain-containing protein [Pseudoflavonifractor sp.]|jgi:hypothetical protein|uniref:S-layer homology domain-containing protein n=1 Tax=Pseudoflavonifractor sp. TaxID=1980281 RepID=UPI003D90B5C5
MKKRFVAAALAALLCAGLVPSASAAFTDVTDPEMAQAVEVLSGLGIVSGDGTGAYYPDSGLTRSQFCKLIVLAEGHGDSVASSAYKTLFSDVLAGRWDAPYVNLAYSEGLVAGYGNGSFGPDDGVTVSQAVTIALRLLGYTDADIGPFWPEDYLSRAEELGLLEGISSDGDHLLTRGEAAILLYTLLTMDTVQGTPLYEGLAAQTVSSALLTGVDVTADDGTAHTVEVWTASGGVKYYSYVNALSEELIGTRGTLLLDESGRAAGFIPDGTVTRTVTLASADGSGLTDGDGNTFSVPNSVSVLLKGETLTWSDSWYDLRTGDAVVLCYSAAGSIEALWVRERETAAGTVLTGWYEDASPNTAAPDTITVLGAQLPVAEEGQDSLRDFSIGDKISVTLSGDGEVIAAEAASSDAPVMAGILTSGTSDTVSVTLSSGITVSGELYSGSVSALNGCLVRVTSPARGKLSVSALGNSSVPGSLNVAAGTLGELTLSTDVVIYDQVNGSGAVEVALSDILVDTVSASSIAYVGTDSAGQVNLLVLEDVTGSCYAYGFLEKGEQTGGSGTMQYTNTTVTVDNEENNTAYITGLNFTDGAVGGVVGTGEGKVAALMTLTAVEDLTRADFDGSDTAAGIPIAADVKVYNAVTETWVTLSQAKAFTDTFTAWYDRDPADGGQIRVIVAGE